MERRSAIPLSTWLGGVCWTPRAFRRSERTITIFMKEVRSMIAKGRSERPARTASFVTIEGLTPSELVGPEIFIALAGVAGVFCAERVVPPKRRKQKRRVRNIVTFS